MGRDYQKAVAGAPVAAKGDEEAPAAAEEEAGEKVDNVEMEDFGEKKEEEGGDVGFVLFVGLFCFKKKYFFARTRGMGTRIMGRVGGKDDVFF